METATNEILLRRETRKPERFAEKKARVPCPKCDGKGYILRSGSKK